jgi:hypothetical protein
LFEFHLVIGCVRADPLSLCTNPLTHIYHTIPGLGPTNLLVKERAFRLGLKYFVQSEGGTLNEASIFYLVSCLKQEEEMLKQEEEMLKKRWQSRGDCHLITRRLVFLDLALSSFGSLGHAVELL